MDKFAQKDLEEKMAYFSTQSEKMGISLEMVEKDFWACFLLKRLFSITPLNQYLTFKGGTSLSKVHNLIKRFSEDVDISIDKTYFNIQNPEEMKSSKASKKAIKELSVKCKQFVQNDLINLLKENIDAILLNKENQWKLETDSIDNDGQTILFFYPTSTTDKNDDYIRPHIKLELGARSDHWPVSHKTVSPYIGEHLEDAPTTVQVLDVERTFWEKATILHKYAHYPQDKMVPLRQSRHYYDFFCLLHSWVKEKAVSEVQLLERVVFHKKLYFRIAWAKYELAQKGSLKLIPRDRVLKEMESDYIAMNEMFFGDIPSWQNIIESISIFETEFNG